MKNTDDICSKKIKLQSFRPQDKNPDKLNLPNFPSPCSTIFVLNDSDASMSISQYDMYSWLKFLLFWHSDLLWHSQTTT